MRLYWLVFLLSFHVYNTFAQASASKDQGSSLVTMASQQGLVHYLGTLDDVNDILLSFKTDGKNCLGELTYLRSQENFQVKGILQNDELRLEEIDGEGQTSGFILATIKQNDLSGEWSNFDGTIASALSLTKVAKPSNVPTNCSDQKWVKRYQGVIKWDEVNMILHRLHTSEIQGTAFFKNQDKQYQVEGTIDTDGNMTLTFFDLGGLQIGTLMGKEKGKNVRAEYIQKSGSKNFASFEIQNELKVVCFDYADYQTSYEIVYPQTTSNSFNKWMTQYVKDWINQCRRQVKEAKKGNSLFDPSARAQHRGYVWFDMVHLDKDIISGNLYFSNTWQDQEYHKVINFDRVNGKDVELSDIIKLGKNFDPFFKQYIKQELIRHPQYVDEGFRKWVNKEDFSAFYVKKDGLAFSTPYNVIYGQAEIVIPYSKLRPFMKNNSITDNL